MISARVDESGRAVVRFGEKTTLVSSRPGGGLYPGSESFDATYLGFIPESRKFNGVCSDGWGHLFGALDPMGNPVLYLTQDLKMEYWTDGDDDPSYAVGVRASRSFVVELSPSEREYVMPI